MSLTQISWIISSCSCVHRLTLFQGTAIMNILSTADFHRLCEQYRASDLWIHWTTQNSHSIPDIKFRDCQGTRESQQVPQSEASECSPIFSNNANYSAQVLKKSMWLHRIVRRTSFQLALGVSSLLHHRDCSKEGTQTSKGQSYTVLPAPPNPPWNRIVNIDSQFDSI